MGWTDALRRLTGQAPPWGAEPLPTADYYFLAGVGDLVSPSGTATPRQPIVQLGPNAWAHADRLVIVRYATAQELAAIEALRWRSVHYVIDDLLPAAATSLELPADYRVKLQRFVSQRLPRILALSPTVVAPSRRILDLFPEHPRQQLDPACLSLLEPAGLPPPTPWSGPIRIAFLGTRSHIASMHLLGEIARRIARASSDMTLHVFLGRHLPSTVAAVGNVVNHDPLGWQEFRAFCRRARFHIGLAPVQDTAFAQARSITKVMDHAAVGAVGIYSPRPPFAGILEHGHNALFAADGAEAWTTTILDLASAPRQATDMARAGSDLAARLGDPARLRAFWLKALGLGSWHARNRT